MTMMTMTHLFICIYWQLADVTPGGVTLPDADSDAAAAAAAAGAAGGGGGRGPVRHIVDS